MAQTSFFEKSYEQENSWIPTGDPQKLTKEEQEAVKEVRVRDNAKLGNKQFVFFMKNGHTRTMTMSPYCEQYPAGTKIRISSIEITELSDGSDADPIYRASGDEA